jgi:peptide chain release factor
MSVSFPVGEHKRKMLIDKMISLGIKEDDLEESFTRASGNGGQNVNKVSTAVHLKHKNSGIEIKCSMHRTQGLNRYQARVLLCEKFEDKFKPENSPRIKTIDKLRKSKAVKARRQKLKRLSTFKMDELKNYDGD